MEEYLGFDNGAETHERTVNIAVDNSKNLRQNVDPSRGNKCRKQ